MAQDETGNDYLEKEDRYSPLSLDDDLELDDDDDIENEDNYDKDDDNFFADPSELEDDDDDEEEGAEITRVLEVIKN